MKSYSRPPFLLTATSVLGLVAVSGALAGETDAYIPLGAQIPLPKTPGQDDARVLQVGVGYTSDDNYTFGQYNGLYQDEAVLIGNLKWQDFSSGDSYWRASVSDLGLDTREGEVSWGRPDRVRVSVSFDSQRQVRNDSGRTPFRGGPRSGGPRSGDTRLELPDNWEGGLTTSDWAVLDESQRQFDRELRRDLVSLTIDTRVGKRWRLKSNFSYEEKEGHGDIGGAIYTDAASGDSVLLRSPVDYNTSEVELGVLYSGERLHLEGLLSYSDFDNKDELLSWQNPYTSFGPDVAYPEGNGGLALAPDNDQVSVRLTGQYIFSATTRLQFDGSYAVASQDQNYLDYTVNPLLLVTEPLPRNDFDGEVATGTVNTRLLLRPLARMTAEVFYKLRDRDYDADRDGYRYVRGDGADQPGQAFTVYNTNHDLRSQTGGLELAYRLPWRSKLNFDYAYEEVKRKNAAVEKTEEDRYTLGYRIQPWSNFTARLELGYDDRKADTYHWDQSYYALLDAELINATPDNQRYINHPELSQYYLSNREQWNSKADFTWLPSNGWNLNLNLQWRDDDYDQTNLGLTEAEWYRTHVSASYAASRTLSASVYAGYDYYETEQSSRAFRGGQEKNAFDIYPPLPQASDPARDWDIEGEDTSITAGASLQWQLAKDIELSMDYSFVHTEAEQDFSTRPGGGLEASDLPEVKTRLHQVDISAAWHMRGNLSLQLDYQYYRYKSDDWAWDDVQPDTIDKVLTFGQSNPNDQINYLGASVIYRWQ